MSDRPGAGFSSRAKLHEHKRSASAPREPERSAGPSEHGAHVDGLTVVLRVDALILDKSTGFCPREVPAFSLLLRIVDRFLSACPRVRVHFERRSAADKANRLPARAHFPAFKDATIFD